LSYYYGIRFDFYLEEMSNAIDRIFLYTQDISYHEFTSNSLIRDAVIRNFEVIGESVKHIPFSYQRQHKSIPWSRMYGMRNFIAHEYFDVDDEILWQIIQQDLAKNGLDIRKCVEHLQEFGPWQPPARKRPQG